MKLRYAFNARCPVCDEQAVLEYRRSKPWLVCNCGWRKPMTKGKK